MTAANFELANVKLFKKDGFVTSEICRPITIIGCLLHIQFNLSFLT